MTQSTGDSFAIRGLAGKKSLKGRVTIHGAKNAALKAMAAAILFEGKTVLENIPDNADVHTQAQILEKLGATIAFNKSPDGGLVLEIDPSGMHPEDIEIDSELGQSMRSSVVLTGPLLSRFGNVSFPAPGGCVIGARPIDLFIDAYAKLGAEISEDDSSYRMKRLDSLKGAEIEFAKISVGATETVMMAAVIADGTTVLRNCAREPEIGNVAFWLNACGADISGIGTSELTIKGTNGKLLSPKAPYRAIPDRIEAGSFAILGALCAEELTIERCEPAHMKAVLDLLVGAGVPISWNENEIRIQGNTLPNSAFRSFEVHTREYPGFPTDLQAQIATFLAAASGESDIEETIFEGRFKYIQDLEALGADVSMNSAHEAHMIGPTAFKVPAKPYEFKARDIRAGFAMVMALLLAEGDSTISNVHLIDRGYRRLEEQLKSLGADVKRM